MRSAILSGPLAAIFFLLLVTTQYGCDIPTESPDFSFTSSVRAPLILDKTFVLLGPGVDGYEPLIDTTAGEFDTLFSAEATSKQLFVNQDVDDFEIGDLDDLISDVELDPVNVDVGIGSLESQDFSSEGFGNEIGLFTTPAFDLGSSPVNSAVPSYPVGSVLVPPTVDLITLDGVSVVSVRLSDATDGVNTFNFTLSNGLGAETLTDGSGNAPQVYFERDAESGGSIEIARTSFNTIPGPGGSASATINLASSLLTADTRVVLAVSTPGGYGPIDASPNAVELAITSTPLEYAETGVDEIPAQAEIDASGDAISLGGDTDFSGIIAAGGSITIQIENTMPMPVVLTDLTARNTVDVGDIAAPSVMIELADLPPGTSTTIPAGSSIELVFPVAGAPISSSIEVDVLATSPGLAQEGVLRQTDGLTTTVNGVVEVDQIFFTPDAEEFTHEGSFEIDVDDVDFVSSDEYIELSGGTLRIDEITNEMGLDFETLFMSMGSFRVPPYGLSDSLVIRFSGDSDNPSRNQFRQITGGSSRTNLEVDLSDVRIYPSNNEAGYYVWAVSESGSPSTLRTTQKIRATMTPEALEIRGVRATADPISVELSEDANNDGQLDLMHPAEVEIIDLSSLGELNDSGIEGLEVNGAQFTFTINTNLGADFVLYAAMMGITEDGEEVFLSGSGDLGVLAGDTIATALSQSGAPVATENLIRLPVSGSPTAGTTVARTILLNNTNSNADAFISSLPTEMRYVGKALVTGTDGGLLEVEKPFDISVSIGVSIPLSLIGNPRFTETLDADLSDLEDLTEENGDFALNEGSVTLSYANGLPAGIETTIEVLDAQGELLITLPDSTGPALILEPAPAATDGTATGIRESSYTITVSREDLEQLSLGREARLQLSLIPETGKPATFRATDTIQLSMTGHFDVTVDVNP